MLFIRWLTTSIEAWTIALAFLGCFDPVVTGFAERLQFAEPHAVPIIVDRDHVISDLCSARLTKLGAVATERLNEQLVARTSSPSLEAVPSRLRIEVSCHYA
jgi:hypothetical protein